MPSVTDRETPDAGRASRQPFRRVTPEHALLIAVSIAYCAVVLWRTSQSMSLQYDEAVYASQVAVEAPGTRFTAPRARGATLLVAPVVSITEWAVALRAYLTVLAGVLMYAAFRPWLAVFRRVGGRFAYLPATAAAGFAMLWVTVLYGNMAYPNLWLAFLLVAGVGYFCRAVTEPYAGARVIAMVTVAFAAASLIRPTDALAVAGPLIVASVAAPAWRRVRPPAAVVAGLLVGWGAWLVEAYARFGGPVERLRRGGEINSTGLTNSLPENLDALDGPRVLCRPPDVCTGVEAIAAAWWVLLPVLVAVGLFAAARSRWSAVAVLVTTAGVAVALPYLFLVDYAAPRFLLPTYGLLAIPAAAAVIWLTGLPRMELRAVAYSVLAGAALLHAGVQQDILDGAQNRLDGISASQVRLADFLRDEQDVRPPCLLWGGPAVQVGYMLKCHSLPVFSQHARPSADDTDLVAALERGDRVVIRLPADAERSGLLAGWRRVELPGGSHVAYLSPEGRDR